MTIVTVTSKGRITLPEAACQEVGMDLIPENCSIQNGSFVAKFEGGGHPG